jgi:hypothetical protein
MLENYNVVIFMSVVTIYTLFFDDIRVLSIDQSYDPIFFALTSLSFLIFCAEILLSSVCKEVYFITFFFWLDLVSTLSLLPDIGWFWDWVTGASGTP